MNRNRCLDLTVVSIDGFGQAEPEQFVLTLSSPGWKWRPGQFAMLRPASFRQDPVWARPLSIAFQDDAGLSFLVQSCGRGTGLMARLKPGETVTVWGPIGTWFASEPETPTLMLAGGVGLAPFLGYAARHPAPDRLELVHGHRLPLSAFPLGRLPEGLGRSEFFLDRGRPEDVARFIGLLESRIKDYAGGLVLACGPMPFLRTVKRLAEAAGARAQLSLESRMACGLGACLGCVTENVAGELVQVCARGPVFWSTDVTLAE
jgi:dihydroorotate dehydrogenase electron transfer subunit